MTQSPVQLDVLTTEQIAAFQRLIQTARALADACDAHAASQEHAGTLDPTPGGRALAGMAVAGLQSRARGYRILANAAEDGLRRMGAL